MNFMQRAALTYLGLVVAIPSIAWWMEANGAAYRGNPAWGLVSSLRYLCFGSVAILIAGGVAFLIIEAMAANAEEADRKQKEAEEKKRAELAAVQYAQRQRENDRREAGRQKQEREEKRTRMEKEKRAREEAMARELEKKRNRTSEAAVDSALDEFG